MVGIAKTISTSLAHEMTNTPIRSTAALASSSFFVGAGIQRFKNNRAKKAQDTGDTGVRLEEVNHPFATS